MALRWVGVMYPTQHFISILLVEGAYGALSHLGPNNLPLWQRQLFPNDLLPYTGAWLRYPLGKNLAIYKCQRLGLSEMDPQGPAVQIGIIWRNVNQEQRISEGSRRRHYGEDHAYHTISQTTGNRINQVSKMERILRQPWGNHGERKTIGHPRFVKERSQQRGSRVEGVLNRGSFIDGVNRLLSKVKLCRSYILSI